MTATKPEANSQRVLLTGSSGYVGSRLADDFCRRGVEFTGIDKHAPPGPRESHFNLSDAERTRGAVAEFAPDVIVHAGTHSALAYRKDFLSAFHEDAEAIVNLLASAGKDARFIFFSSSYVYSGLDPQSTVSEDAVLRPEHNFGVAKAFFEQLVLRTHPNSVVFRLSSVYGAGVQLHPNAIAGMANECVSSGEVTVWGSGKRRMQYVYMNDVIAHSLDGFRLPPGIYNLGSEEYTSVADTAAMVAEQLGARVRVLADKPEGETLPFMATEKLRRASPKAAATTLKAGLREYLAEFQRAAAPPG